MNFAGMDLTSPLNRIRAGVAALAANVRAYLKGGFALRNALSDEIISALPTPIHTIRRLNDSTPNGPSSGYSLVIGAGTYLYVWNSTIGLVKVAEGLTGNPVSMVPFRPNTSPQPWMYIADSAVAGAVTLITKYLINGDAVNFPSNGMMKVRSDGLCYKMGLKEPQVAPIVSTSNTNEPFGGGSGNLLATTIPWTNHAGLNTSYNFGESNGFPGTDGTAPFIINCENANYITISALTGVANINGNAAATPTTLGPSPSSSTNPGHYIQAMGTGATPPATATVVTGAFTDGNGNVVPVGVAPLYIPSVVDVGAIIGVTNGITVPYGAVAFQIGINSTGNTFNSNSGAFLLTGYVTTLALPPVTAILGSLTAYYWGDSPTSGPVGAYIWKNPDDPGGSGPTRSTSDAIGSTTGNSFIFDATFTAGIPGLPGVGSPSLPMEWTVLNPQSVATGTNPVFSAPITNPYTTNTSFNNFNWCLTGNIYFPAAGDYTFVITNHDDFIWGIGGGVKFVSITTSGSGETSATGLSGSGQTITVVNGLALLPRGNYTSGLGGNYQQSTVVVSVPAAGIYPIEFDYDYWYHSGRIFLVEGSAMPSGSPTIIPPLPSAVREDTQYKGVYRSSATGAPSNPGPGSAVEAVPVTSNTISMPYSNDPQADVCDYYRIDSVTSDYTYVNTGPNDGLGGTIGGVVYNTPVTDSLTDTELGTKLLDYSNYEPFPSIDLPQKGTCDVSGGVITWVSGGAIGGTATGFNPRWLEGTTILIGSPTSLAYTFISRPVSNTITIPEVPDGTDLAYEIEQPILANQPMPYMWGPSDNIPFALAVGDTLRQGTLYWSAAGNLDAAPDTNQQDLTDPSEALVSGLLTGGKSFVATIRRAIAVVPNFFNALATATGTSGSTWSVRTTSINRGLFIPRCFCVSGGGLVYFRVDDGIHISPNGLASKSITDDTLYPLFSHEGSVPTSITRSGITIIPPNDALPELHKFTYQNGYMYYDYPGPDGQSCTLVYDEAAKGFIWDAYSVSATIHAADEGESTQGILVGCSDGTVRQLTAEGTETVAGTVLTPAFGAESFGHFFEVTVEYLSAATVALSFIAADSGNGSYGPNPLTLPATGSTPTKYTTKVSANKFQWMQAKFVSTDPEMQVYIEGFAVAFKPWGSTGPFQAVQPFTPAGGLGAEA